jgi:hypothetical protein
MKRSFSVRLAALPVQLLGQLQHLLQFGHLEVRVVELAAVP